MSTHTTPLLPARMTAVRISEYGGPSALTVESIPLPVPSPSQVLVQIHHAGINYIDTYHRTGLYPNPLPLTIGREGSGVVVQLGADVKEVVLGDRVVFFAQGAYAQYVAVEASAVFRLPDNVDTKTAAAVYLQGLTAHYLTTTTYPIKKGDWVLVHAAAGGTGSLVVQMAKLRGATVIGTAGSDEKVTIARAAGADHVINYNTTDFVAEVKRLTNNVGVHVVYDGVGAATYEKSLKSLRKLGYLVCFGNASGPVPPIAPLDLTKYGSVFLTRPTLADYIATRSDLVARASELFAWIASGSVKIRVAKLLPLERAREAHELLEGRSVAGKIVLEVSGDSQ